MNISSPTIFSIKQYAIHDGPNIRTTVFFKGCPLSCQWCHNPEGLSSQIELIADFDKCIGCKECVSGCPEQALTFVNKNIIRDEAKCSLCLECLEICPALVYETSGYHTNVNEVMTEIKKDLPFYDQSGGGVTFSGGEPLMQPDFLYDLLNECEQLGIHRTVDTSLFAADHIVNRISDKTNLFLVDLKLMDAKKHKLYTGVDNTVIHSNFKNLIQQGQQCRVRVPLVPGINDDDENLQATASFLSNFDQDIPVDLLPYHSSATAKYSKLGMDYPLYSIKATAPRLEKAMAIFHTFGITAQKG